MGYKRITPDQIAKYDQARAQGWTVAQAAQRAGVSVPWARGHDRKQKGEWKLGRDEPKQPGPIPLEDLRGDAKRALTDFGLFQRRYFGRIATPWQEEAAQRTVELLESPDREYVVVNAPPGSGKTTLFTHDIPVWLTVRNRAIRGMIGSRVSRTARTHTQRIRRTLERTLPIRAEGEDLARGLAVDAIATVAGDYGRFKPLLEDVWAQAQFVVEQHGGVQIEEKEPTWSAYGFDEGYIGQRFNVVLWDDAVDRNTMLTVERREKTEADWDDVAEKRVEPGGLLILQGQRLGPDDLYRYNLNKQIALDQDEDDDIDDDSETRAKYHHIVFRAHYDDRCQADHRPSTAAYYPTGCLLDPRRLPWRDLRMEMANPRNNFATLYQQEDADPAELLVNPLWVHGGKDPKTDEVFPGCKDMDRDIWEFPHGVTGDWFTVASVDPSPTKFWSIQLWTVRCVDGRPIERLLIDHYRGKLDVPGFLDEHYGQWIGLADDWQERSEKAGWPITHWIVEQNAAQRFMLQTDLFRRWAAQHRVVWVAHTTSTNKSNPDYGVQSVAGLWRDGLIRLPWKTNKVGESGFLASAKLVEEVTHWPQWSTEDCVMAHWFVEMHLPQLIPPGKPLPRFPRPSWLANASTFAGAR